ncbi:uncharacterized protein MKK02DRAFT_31306 [Dioszegia hungarica]|uniref:Glycosyl transferase CAP10 domain-containing protein n=1 Tax=Dioszegia hungarica TaxID=4972 RepID=A0AA38HG65_9TREE|nr:uncharacterized protein MKK02DRAFT_31306 [Dioszegia hungarica]KAI9639049.1 hypothetical protein MKK02DRAFT_31306 [Dioszegia hungarica]
MGSRTSRLCIHLSLDDGDRLPPSQNPEEPMLLAVWVDDVSHHPPSAKLLSQSRQLAYAAKVWDESELLALEAEEETKKGWGNACDPALNRDFGQDVLAAVQRNNAQQASFIDEPMVYADPCKHPEHLRQNGEMIMKEESSVRGLLPLASLNSPLGGGEIIGPTTVGRKAIAPYMPWSAKTEHRLWWRGNAHSAFYYDKWDWRAGQRLRLSDFASGRRERMEAEMAGGMGMSAEERGSPVLLEREERVRREWREREVLRETYLNVSLISTQRAWSCGGHYAHVFFCNTEDGRPNATCPQDKACDAVMDAEYDFAPYADKAYELKHKFRLDIDGFGWTTRWREELSKNNVVIKITLYPEWWTPQAIPWYHYIPGSYTFNDLYDIMAFFTGTPEERAGEISEKRRVVLVERDKMAEEIAARGREFAMTRLRYEDMRVYMFLLLLEYRRAWSDDRKAATFKLD